MSIKDNQKLRGNRSLKDTVPTSISEHTGVKVKITDYNPATHRLTVVKESNNKPLLEDQEVDTEINQKKLYDQPTSKMIKTSLNNDAPIIEVSDEVASIRGGSNNGFFTYRRGGGNIIKGPLSIAAKPENIRISGITTLNPLITTGFASTIVTPIPTCIISVPGASAIKSLVRDVMVMGTIIAAAGAGALA